MCADPACLHQEKQTTDLLRDNQDDQTGSAQFFLGEDMNRKEWFELRVASGCDACEHSYRDISKGMIMCRKMGHECGPELSHYVDLHKYCPFWMWDGATQHNELTARAVSEARAEVLSIATGSKG